MNLQTNDLDFVAGDDRREIRLHGAEFLQPDRTAGAPEQTRRELVAAARQTGAWLVEDDPYGGLSYDGPIPPSALEISAEDEPDDGSPYGGPVIYLGTLSKMVAPGLRVGWVIAAPEMIAALTTAKQARPLHQRPDPAHDLQDFRGRADQSMNPVMLRLYGGRRDALLAAMDRHLTDFFDWQFPEGGMFVWASAKDERLNTDALFKVGLQELVCVTPSSVFDSQEEFRRGIG